VPSLKCQPPFLRQVAVIVFARQAMGPTGGYLTGLAVLIEYALGARRHCLFSSVLRWEALLGF